MSHSLTRPLHAPATAHEQRDVTVHGLRLRYIDTITWANARGGTSLQWSQPREEIQLLPLTYN